MNRCDYCNNTGVVGGVMPWKNGGAHANACPYCASSPVLKFKAGVTPWTGCIMPVPDVHKNTPGFSTYAEPDVPGERVIIVIDPRWRMWCWGENGRFIMSPMLHSELTVLATHMMFEGADEYACGMALEGTFDIEADVVHLYMALPLLSLLDGKDTKPLGTRRFDLDQAVVAVGEALAYTLVPRVMVHVSEKVKPANLDKACDALFSEHIMVKQTLGYWGVEPCWSKYVRGPAEEEDF